jgi:uncharacterized protein YndB with AHSA1/START domain
MNNTKQTVEVTKQFTKSVQELYDAWINEDKLKQWWHPANNKLVHVENEVKEGGNIKYEFETHNGDKSFVISGQYKEAEPSAKLVYTWNWTMPGSDASNESHFELIVKFTGNETGSGIHIIQRDLDKEEAIHPRQKGWEEELESLAQFLG